MTLYSVEHDQTTNIWLAQPLADPFQRPILNNNPYATVIRYIEAESHEEAISIVKWLLYNIAPDFVANNKPKINWRKDLGQI